MNTFPADAHQRAWIALDGVDDAEVWIANSNLELNFYLEEDRNAGLPNGQGICFELELGGEIYIHTTSEGMILLDVTEAADWTTPILSACTGAKPARGRIWVLPENTLVQLILGLNSLISSYKIVLQHQYGMHY